jgi:hypothetical protein
VRRRSSRGRRLAGEAAELAAERDLIERARGLIAELNRRGAAGQRGGDDLDERSATGRARIGDDVEAEAMG